MNLLKRTSNSMIGRIFVRTVYKEIKTYDDRYEGKFDYHDKQRYPRRLGHYKEEELLDDVNKLKAIDIEEPSPFHIVRRVKSMAKLPWTQKVALRRLNLHSTFNGECVVVPNTPQFNSLLIKVKHLLELKPAKFLDGRIPTQEDIGAIKVCPYTGTVKIDEKLRLLERRANIEKPLLWQGSHLRTKIKRIYGFMHNHHLG